MRLSMLGLIALGLLDLGGQSALASPRIGAALVRPDSVACVTFRGEPRRTGDHVLLFLFSPPRVVDGWIRGRSTEPCNQSVGLEAQSYLLGLRHSISEAEEVGVAVYDLSARVEYLDGEFIVRTQGASAPLQFRQCASQEGLHLTAWRGSRRTWHEYWYLGFDLEPNCSEEEASE